MNNEELNRLCRDAFSGNIRRKKWTREQVQAVIDVLVFDQEKRLDDMVRDLERRLNNAIPELLKATTDFDALEVLSGALKGNNQDQANKGGQQARRKVVYLRVKADPGVGRRNRFR